MILHCVHLKLTPQADRAELADVMQGLAALAAKMPALRGFRHGPNLDFEGKSEGYPYGFVAEFDDAAGVATYAQDQDHRALGARLVALCEGGADGITVFDLEVAA